MKTTQTMMMMAALLAAPMVASAETWSSVSVVDTQCFDRVKADPDKHETKCALQCVKGGYGLITADGSYLKFDAAGNEKTHAALLATRKTDHLRATVVGDRSGDQIKVTSLVID